MFSFLTPQKQEKKRWRWSIMLFNGRLPKLGFFLAQLCLDTQIKGKIGRNVAFSSSSNARKKKVEMVNGALQWETLQAWYLYCSIVSRYSTTMTKLAFPFLAPQLQEKQWWRCSMVLLNGRLSKISLFLSQLCLDTRPK